MTNSANGQYGKKSANTGNNSANTEKLGQYENDVIRTFFVKHNGIQVSPPLRRLNCCCSYRERVPANNCKQKPTDDEFGKILQNNSDNLKSSLVFCKPSWTFCLNLTVPSQKCNSSHCCVFQMCLLLLDFPRQNLYSAIRP